MSQFIRCPDCGFTICFYNEFFLNAKNTIVKEYLQTNNRNYNQEKLYFKEAENSDLIRLYDSLNIKKMCCRMHMSTGINFDKK
jgi:hypothetical protein